MIESRSGFGFLHKAGHATVIDSNFGRQNLQNNFAIQFCVLREENFAHSTHAKLGADFVTTESSAGGNCHFMWRKLSACVLLFLR